MRTICLLFGITNATVIVFGDRTTQIIWLVLFVLACHVLVDMVIGYGQHMAHKQAYDDAATFVDLLSDEDGRQRL